MEDFGDSYFVNYKFLLERGGVDESNWLDYFAEHPDFEAGCLNRRPEGRGSVQECARRGDSGVFYDCLRQRGVLLIGKYLLDGDRPLLLGQYYLLLPEGKLFSSTNLKGLLRRKAANLGSLLYDLSEALLEKG